MTDTSSIVDVALPAGEPASELRTFLFADVRGYTRFTQERGDGAAAALVARFASVTRELVHTHGGHVIELRGDEALATFGSARQALRAAVELQERFVAESQADPSLPLPVGIGLDAGEAVVVEGGYRGDALNLAARLCNLAGPGEVLASEGVVYLGRRVPGVTYAERGLVPLKGFADPVHIIQVLREGGPGDGSGGNEARDGSGVLSPAERTLPIGGFLGALPSGALVGRDEEWSQVMASLEAVMQGAGRLVLLSGEPGVGKTRLAQEVTLKARHWGFLVATGRCYEPESTAPFYPFLEPLVTLYRASPGSIRAEVPRRWSALARLLPDEILPDAVDLARGGSGLDGDGEDQQRLFRAVTGFIGAIAESVPVALLIDDLHWADDSSLLLLQHLARYTHSQRVLLLGTYRDVEVHRQHLLESALLDLNREQLVHEIDLRRLSLDGTIALVAEVLGEREDVTDLASLVYRRTDGNAFFVGEMLRALVERGDVYRKDGRWERRAITDLEVPKSIRSVIGQRLSRLDGRSQEILRDASVLGQRFMFDDLLALGVLIPLQHAALPEIGGSGTPAATGAQHSGWTEEEIETALEGAIAAGLVRETDGDRYAFNHALTQQALYAELSTRRRKRLHLAAGKALEWMARRGPKETLERRAAELAWHFLEGDDPEQALPYTLAAGDGAEEVFAHGEAERHYRTALELAQELGDQARELEALEKLAEVLVVVGRYDEALQILERVAGLQRATNNVEGEACAVAQIGQVHYLRGTGEAGIQRLLPLVESIERAGGDAAPGYGVAALWAALARLYGDLEKFEDQLEAAERALELARAIKDRQDVTRLVLGAEITRSVALWNLGWREEALHKLEDVIPRAEAAGDLDNLSRALFNAANLYAVRGEFAKDRLYEERALELAERRGDPGAILLGTLQLSTTAFVNGDWERARTYLERAEEIVDSLSSSRLSIWPVNARGWMSLRQGDLEAAAACAEEVISLAAGGDTDWHRIGERLVAEVDLGRGKPRAAVTRLTPLQEQSGAKRDAGFMRTLARAHLALGNLRRAHELATKARCLADEEGDQSELVETLIVHGMVSVAQGNVTEAEQALTEALSLARSMPFPYGEAWALEELARLHGRRGEPDRGRGRLSASLAIYRRIGARADMERVQRELGSYQA